MKSILVKISLLIAICVGFVSCGGSGGASSIEGPTLSIGEAMSLVLDQLYINGGLDDEYSNRAEYSVYLRDAATGQDVACTTAEGGMEKLSTPGIYYGGLSIPFVEVDDEHPSEMARFQLIFVDQDVTECPDPIGEEDDLAGESAEFMFDNLVDNHIWATNGRAVAVLRVSSEDERNVRSMAPAFEDGLIIDELYFENGSEGEEAGRYYIFMDEVEDGETVYQCQIEDEYMRNIRFGNLVYAALGYPISCFDAADDDFLDKRVRLGLYIQRDSGPSQIGETEPMLIMDIIGERIDFTNDKGYVSFRGVATTPFGSQVIRLEELAALQDVALSYELTPSIDPTIELHLTPGNSNYIVACAGEAQGLVGVETPGVYDGLSAKFVAAEGQTELFGWSTVVLKLVERNDDLTCPSPYGSSPTVLAESEELSGAMLSEGAIVFENGAGTAALERVVEDD